MLSQRHRLLLHLFFPNKFFCPSAVHAFDSKQSPISIPSHHPSIPVQLLEWWYSAGERALGERKALEPPPPPPPLAPAPDGLALPEDTSLCPICSSKRVNPTLVATSGYAYCYVCIHKHVTERGCCPVTLEPAKLSDLWRLYPGM